MMRVDPLRGSVVETMDSLDCGVAATRRDSRSHQELVCTMVGPKMCSCQSCVIYDASFMMLPFYSANEMWLYTLDPFVLICCDRAVLESTTWAKNGVAGSNFYISQ